MRTVITLLQDLGLLAARLVLGGLLLLHGIQRWNRGIDTSIAYLRAHGVPQPEVFGWGAQILELVGGVLLIFGLGTPLVALAVCAEHVLILWFVTRHGFSLQTHATAAAPWETNAVYAAFALLLAVHGSGRAGIDTLFRRDDDGDRAPRRIRDEDPA